MLPAHVSSSRRGCPGSPVWPWRAGATGDMGLGTPPPPPPGSAGSTAGHPRCRRVAGPTGGAAGIPRTRGRQGRCSPTFGGDARGVTPAGDPPPSRKATHPLGGAGGRRWPKPPGQRPRRVSCSPGMLWAEPPRSRATTNRPEPAFPKPSWQSGSAGRRRQPGRGEGGWGEGDRPSYRSPPGSARSRANPAPPPPPRHRVGNRRI